MNVGVIEEFKTYKKGKWQSFFLRNWWVVSFLAIVYFIFAHGAAERRAEIGRLREQLTLVTSEKSLASEAHASLQQQLESQSDPKWVERILMEKLGLVPEGHRKVVFR
jgi:hypothetical protein